MSEGPLKNSAETENEPPQTDVGPPPVASVVDLFCGAGGLSHGFYQEGFTIAAGIDFDESCRHPFEVNNKGKFLKRDVATLMPSEIESCYAQGQRRILVGCAPCQPFSTYNQKNDDPKWELLSHFGELINEVRPDVVSMENVPRLLAFRGGVVFEKFVQTLRDADYDVVWDVLYGPDYGLAQTRSRLVLLASRLGPISLPAPSHADAHRSVFDEIGDLPAISHGEVDIGDPLHRASRLSELNVRRIGASKPGGTWRDWPKDLVAECHTQPAGRGYSSVYGRMSWNEPSPTMTTQFFGFGNGRFGHPEQNRALSLREGAMLQGFPRTYEFCSSQSSIKTKIVGRLIGNAVPVKLAAAVARAVKSHLSMHPA